MNKLNNPKPKTYNLKTNYIIGIDEVGRGCLAGPVTVSAVLLPHNFKFGDVQPPKINVNIRRSNVLILKDSKKLTPRQREIWFHHITQINADQDADKPRTFCYEQKVRGKRGFNTRINADNKRINADNISVNQRSNQRKSAIYYAIASVSPKVIDRINVSNAANLAATRAIIKLAISHLGLANGAKIFLDGGLYVNKKTLLASGYTLNPKTIIKGDEKIKAIMLASIVAKVTRDRIMKKLHKKYPRYDFIHNVGYGTRKHIKAIHRFGHSPIHRRSFTLHHLKRYH